MYGRDVSEGTIRVDPRLQAFDEPLRAQVDWVFHLPPRAGEISEQQTTIERDEMWRDVGSKANQRGLWQAIDRATSEVLAYGLGPRQDEVFLELTGLLEPFGITHFNTDDWGA